MTRAGRRPRPAPPGHGASRKPASQKPSSRFGDHRVGEPFGALLDRDVLAVEEVAVGALDRVALLELVAVVRPDRFRLFPVQRRAAAAEGHVDDDRELVLLGAAVVREGDGRDPQAGHGASNDGVRLRLGGNEFEPATGEEFVRDRLGQELLHFHSIRLVLERLQEHLLHVFRDVGGPAHEGVAAASQQKRGHQGRRSPQPP